MQTKKTPLYDKHIAHGANMGIFGEFEMPLWYPSGAKAEHLAVLTHAGLFDTSHMAAMTVEGPGALELLQLCFTRDLSACLGKNKSPLVPDRCVYGAFLNEAGGVIDDAILYQFDANLYMIVANSGQGSALISHLTNHKAQRDVELTDLTAKL